MTGGKTAPVDRATPPGDGRPTAGRGFDSCPGCEVIPLTTAAGKAWLSTTGGEGGADRTGRGFADNPTPGPNATANMKGLLRPLERLRRDGMQPSALRRAAGPDKEPGHLPRGRTAGAVRVIPKGTRRQSVSGEMPGTWLFATVAPAASRASAVQAFPETPYPAVSRYRHPVDGRLAPVSVWVAAAIEAMSNLPGFIRL